MILQACPHPSMVLLPSNPTISLTSTTTESVFVLEIHRGNTVARTLSWQRRGGAFWQQRGPSWSLPHTGENSPKLKEGWKFRFSKLCGEAPWNYTTQILGHLGFWVRVGGCPAWWSGRFETKHVTELGSWSSPGSLSDLQLTACLQGIGSLTAVDVQVLAESRGWREIWRRLLWTLSGMPSLTPPIIVSFKEVLWDQTRPGILTWVYQASWPLWSCFYIFIYLFSFYIFKEMLKIVSSL